MTILTLIGTILSTLATLFFFSVGKLFHPTSQATTARWILCDVIVLGVGVVLAWLGIWGGRERYTEEIPSKNSTIGVMLTLLGTAAAVWLGGPVIMGQSWADVRADHFALQKAGLVARLQKWAPHSAFLKNFAQSAPGTSPDRTSAPANQAPKEPAFAGRTAKTEEYIR